MEKEVLDIITEILTNERLDSIAFQNEEYMQAEDETDRKQALLEEMLSEEQRKVFEEFVSSENHRMAVYTALSYKQGMKDLTALLASLL